MGFQNKMWICLLYLGLGSVLAVPTDEFRAIVHEGDLPLIDNSLIKQIIPSGYSPQIYKDDDPDFSRVPNVDDKDSEYFKSFYSFIEKGVTEKGLIFNVYDDDMRNAAIALFRLLRDTRLYNRIDYDKLRKWASTYVNDDMYDYARRLTSLYSNAYVSEDKFLPPFVFKPNYYINGEAIVKALFVKNNYGKISETVLKNYQVIKINDKNIAINTNYSGWNVPLDGCDEQISYFKDDIALNSYYYGVHLLHPFWMPNEELDEMYPKHAEHYYFAHQQLLARYRLEKEHLGPQQLKLSESNCEPDYNPYLYYENGLAFPTRSSVLGNFADDLAHLKSIDIAIRECIYRGLVIMENGTFIKVSSDNYIDLMTKLIRANLDGIKTAKLVRSIFGYGNNGYPVTKPNPTPSLLHHSQTTLRDPVYWFLIERGLDYFSEYTNCSELYDVSKYETDEIVIADVEFSNITTTFEYSLVNLNKAVENTNYNKLNIFARQRRLTHLPFSINFTIETKAQKYVIVRLFLGPQCDVNNCSHLHYRFFELDCYHAELNEGETILSWSPQSSGRYSTYDYNDFYSVSGVVEDNYNIYKFPKNLAIPKGLPEGLNLTMFVMITEDSKSNENNFPSNPSMYRKVLNKIESKPLGFPLHRKAEDFNDSALNYKFFNITVFHKKESVDDTGYFSPQLY